jgi:hypothetical protein
LTTPEQAVIPYLPAGTFTKTDAAGVFGFTITTGSVFGSLIPGGFPIGSEGALGNWAMSCRGNQSGRVGIAWFTITGNTVDL